MQLRVIQDKNVACLGLPNTNTNESWSDFLKQNTQKCSAVFLDDDVKDQGLDSYARILSKHSQVLTGSMLTKRLYNNSSLSLGLESDFMVKECLDKSGKEISALVELVSKIESIVDLKYGWDGYSASPIGRNVVDDAITLLKAIPSNLPLPDVSPTPDEEILMVWEKDAKILMVSVFGDECFHAYSKVDGNEAFIDNEPINLFKLPDSLVQLIREFV